MQQSQTMPILLNLVAALIGAFGQWFYKMGSARLGAEPIWRNWPIFAGMILFCVVMALFVVAFKVGGKLSVTYPMYATTFLWGALIAIYLEREPWHWGQILGIFLVIAGVSLVAIFSPST